MDNSNLKKIQIQIHGMHCTSCEVLIEKKWKKVNGVERVQVRHVDGQATLWCTTEPDRGELEKAIQEDGYSLTRKEQDKKNDGITAPTRKKEYLEIGAAFLIIFSVYLVLKQFDLIPEIGVSGGMSYGVVFLIGLVAASSTCIAVAGGLLMAVAGKYNQEHPELSGWQKFKPLLSFNLGRVVSYTVFGGLIGLLGSAFTFSSQVTGIITIIASIAMILLGFQLLKIFPSFQKWQPKMPKAVTHYFHNVYEKHQKSAPFLMGASTFFLPCGFTQALQLYVLSQGNFTVGLLTMFVFSLGTLPALLSLSALSSFLKGKMQRYFLKLAGAMVIILGFFTIRSGLILAGIEIPGIQSKNIVEQNDQTDPNVKLVGGKQVVKMKVIDYEYEPSQFTVTKGIPVRWEIDGSQAAGCAQVITLRKLGITKYLSPQGVTVIEFTPDKEGKLTFTCSMGMTTPGTFRVTAEKKGSPPPCDTSVMECAPKKTI